jgi:mannose-6-phosphate isomerase-like protein (cupin superfamily)
MITPVVLVALLGAADASAQAQAVEKALITAEPKLHRCWEQAAADDYRVAGEVDLAVTVGAEGKADKVTVKADSIGKKALEECVSRAFGDARFGAAFAPGDAVEVPVTFKAESNVTLRADDVKGKALNGAEGTAKVLIDAQTAKAEQASLVWVDLQGGARWVRPSPKGKAFIYVRRGRALFAGQPASSDDVVVLDDGAAPLVTASGHTELLVLFVPPGAEKAYRDGTKIPAPTEGGPPPRIVKLNTVKHLDILGGKGDAWIYVENDAASVAHVRVMAGASLPEHRHDGVGEFVYSTTGTGELTIDGDKYPVGPFTAVYIPPGAKHSFTVSSGGRVELIQFYAPSGPEQRYKGN